jgi:hypothetical protein
MNIEIKRAKGLTQAYVPKEILKEKEIFLEGVPLAALKPQLEEFSTYFATMMQDWWDHDWWSEEDLNKQLQKVDWVLLPAQINDWMKLVNSEALDEYQGLLRFTGRLIQNSYMAGFSLFRYSTIGEVANDLPMNMYASQENPIQIEVSGNCNIALANSEYVILMVEGNMGEACGKDSKYCVVEIHGDCGHNLGEHAEDCMFTVHGKIGTEVDQENEKEIRETPQGSTREMHLLEKANSIGNGAKRCIFKTSNTKTLERFLEVVPKGNQVVYIKNGVEQIVRDYAT